MTSLNGITWTLQTSAADNSWQSVCWSPELGLFCAVSGNISVFETNLVMTSSNGIDWTSAVLPTESLTRWQTVCWSPELGLFCAGSSISLGDTIATSPNGIDWTMATNSDYNVNLSCICWSSELGIFAATSFQTMNWMMISTPVYPGKIRSNRFKNLYSGLKVQEGANQKQGIATLVAGTVTVANNTITANSRILLTKQVHAGTAGAVRVSARVAGTSFTITSYSVGNTVRTTDTGTIAYEIIEIAP